MPKAKTEAKPALNLRNFPPDLMASLKTKAAEQKLSLRDYCIRVLSSIEIARPVVTIHADNPKPETVAALKTVAGHAAAVTTASQLPPKEGHPPGSAAGKCWRCGSTLIPWGPGQTRCRSCAVNYPAG